MLIFSYGSNMLLSRLKVRIPSVRLIGPAKLTGYKLLFNKHGNDGSAKANAHYTGNDRDIIWGVIHDIEPGQKPVLDKIESLGCGYNERSVIVVDLDNKKYNSTIYCAMKEWINNDLKPFEWYRNFVLLGALENKLPDDYIESIRQILYDKDPDPNRDEKNRRILQTSEVYSHFSPAL